MSKRKISPDDLLSVNQCAEYGNVKPIAIYKAIEKGRIPLAVKEPFFRIRRGCYDIYRMSRNNRFSTAKIDGERVYDPSEGRYSVGQVAKMLSNEFGMLIDRRVIYHLINKGKIKSSRIGHHIVIDREEANKLYHSYYDKLKMREML